MIYIILKSINIWDLQIAQSYRQRFPQSNVSALRTFLGSTSPELRLAETVAVKAPVASRKGLRCGRRWWKGFKCLMVLKGWHFLRLLQKDTCLNGRWEVLEFWPENQPIFATSEQVMWMTPMEGPCFKGTKLFWNTNPAISAMGLGLSNTNRITLFLMPSSFPESPAGNFSLVADFC